MINDLLFFPGNIYLSFGISLSNPVFSVSLSTVFEVFCGECLDTFVILSGTLLQIKPRIAPSAPSAF